MKGRLGAHKALHRGFPVVDRKTGWHFNRPAAPNAGNPFERWPAKRLLENGRKSSLAVLRGRPAEGEDLLAMLCVARANFPTLLRLPAPAGQPQPVWVAHLTCFPTIVARTRTNPQCSAHRNRRFWHAAQNQLIADGAKLAGNIRSLTSCRICAWFQPRSQLCASSARLRSLTVLTRLRRKGVASSGCPARHAATPASSALESCRRSDGGSNP